MKNLLWVALGMFLMFIVLKMLSQRGDRGSSATSQYFIALAKTPQAMNLVRTNEFKELVKTMEFRTLIKTLATNELNAISNTLTTFSIE